MSTKEGSKRTRAVSTNLQPEQNSSDPLKDLDSNTTLDSPQSATSVENTPVASGETPSDQRAVSQTIADQSLQEIYGDPGSGILQDSNTSNTTASSIVDAATYPTYFQERVDQIFYHEAIVYIQGVDVSPWLQGQIRISPRLNEQPSTLTFDLNNAANRFTLTPENLQGFFRTAVGQDYDESAKKTIFDFKSDLGNNPVDPLSGGRRWPISHQGLIFHKFDPIRAWIKNPIDDPNSTSQWIPIFTGYIISRTCNKNFINAESVITVNCEDIRHIMQRMRVNTNTITYVVPEEILEGTSSDLLMKEYKGPVNKQFEASFFRNLTARSEHDNPWVDLSLKNLVHALTFADNAQDIIDNAGREQIAIYSQQIAKLSQDIKVAELSGNQTSLQSLKTELNSVQNKWYSAISSISAGVARQKEVKDSDQTVEAIPGTEAAPPSKVNFLTSDEINKSGRQSRLGSMQQGIFPIEYHQVSTTIPSEPKKRITFLQNWYSLSLFGTPKRIYFPPSAGNEENFAPRNGLLSFEGNYRYWTEEEVREAGEATLTDHAWRPDSQAVHMMEPAVNTSGDSLFQELSSTMGASTSGSRQWIDRLNLIVDACKVVDYRFYVTGTGDFVFEPPMYDFSPSDFGTYENVLTFDLHINEETLDEERGDPCTVVTAKGGVSGLSDIDPKTQNTYRISPDSITWSPILASRFGLIVDKLSYPRITDKNRLNQLTALHFQKKLGLMDQYDIGIVYRPWLIPNKPIYNKYCTRYALIDEVTHSIPVTSGQGNPSTQVVLSYTRPLDEAGIPRFVTGGASQAVFFGVGDGTKQISEAIAAKSKSLINAVEQLQRDRSKMTSFELAQIRQAFGGFLPLGQDFYNVVGAAKAEGDPYDGYATNIEDYMNKYNTVVEEANSTKTINGTIKDTVDPKALQDLINQTNEIITNLSKQGLAIAPETTSAGVMPLLGSSGIRNVDIKDPEENKETPKESKVATVDRGASGFVLDWEKNGNSVKYEITEEDRLNLLRGVAREGKPYTTVAWTLIQRFVYLYPKFSTLSSIVTAYAQPINPRWLPYGDLHLSKISQLTKKYNEETHIYQKNKIEEDIEKENNQADLRAQWAVAEENTIPPKFVKVVNDILSGNESSPAINSTHYCASFATKGCSPEQAKQEAITWQQKYRPYLTLIEIKEGYNLGVNWFFAEKPPSDIVVVPSKIG